jgi:hypothetical protein
VVEAETRVVNLPAGISSVKYFVVCVNVAGKHYRWLDSYQVFFDSTWRVNYGDS